eukprot:Tbor_TRINITY_DN3136_c0_g1::TRINITY_DN3136_c0_g1_i1::g.14738::m.14738/K14768/UTP7, WDR46; U3 small nucleolar RNA-associated protein 7
MSSASQKLQAKIRERRTALREEQKKDETAQIRGRWVTDNNALQYADVRRQEKVQRSAPKRIAKLGLMKIEDRNSLLEAEDREVTDRVTQSDIVKVVDHQTKQKKFELILDQLGPYNIDYSRNGTHLVMAGLRGHLAIMNWSKFSLVGETQLKDKCSDVKFLVDHSLTAVAQKRYVYIYSSEGEEVHILSKMANMDRLEYLPKHMLLVGTSSTFSTMHYMDISTGQEVCTKGPSIVKDPTTCLKQNPANGVVASCDLRGIVKFWSPTVEDPLVQLKAHKGPLQDIAFHTNGKHFVTLGGDHKMKIWDTRTMRALEEFGVTYCFNTIDISYSGLVAMGGGTNIQVWKDMFSASRPSGPYMKHGLGYGNIATRVRFAPFEDVLGIGHSRGFSSIIVPGSGEANPDFYYANPHETETHRKERVVTNLLDKLPPDTISLDLKIAGVNEKHLEQYKENLEAKRKLLNIRSKKQVRKDTSLGDKAPTGLGSVGNDDEVDEQLGFEEKGPSRIMLSKKELVKEKKMAKWDKKDTADKIISKQKMRQSRLVKKMRHRNLVGAKKAREEAAAELKQGKSSGGANKADSNGNRVGSKRITFNEDGEPNDEKDLISKKSRSETDSNAAFKRFRFLDDK